RLEQREPRYPVWPALSLDECDLLAPENEAGYRAFVERLGEDQLAESVRYRTSQGKEFVTPVLDILAQVVTHGPYHRGQIAKAMGRGGGAPVNRDFPPAAREPEPAGYAARARWLHLTGGGCSLAGAPCFPRPAGR